MNIIFDIFVILNSQWFHLKSHSQPIKILQRRRLKVKRMPHSFIQLLSGKQYQP